MIARSFHWTGLIALLVVAAFASQGANAQSPVAWHEQLQPLIARFCIDCHGPDTQKAKLRLDTLPTDLGDPAHFKTWAQALERMTAGEMPPRKKPQPPAAQLKPALVALERSLVAADLARRAADGRTVLRRLNRVEYQNTLRDLLGIDVELKDLLPEDNASFGFDNIGQSLNVSSVLMERYLEAADVALDAALQRGPKPDTVKLRIEHDQLFKPHKLFRPLKDAVAVFAAGYSPTDVRGFRAPVDGRYKIRICGYGFQSAGKPVTIRVYDFSFRSGHNDLIGYFDFPADQPTVAEFSARLEKGHMLKPQSYRFSQEINKVSAEEYTGPGIAYQWIEVEGPILDTWPPRGYQEIFGTQASPAGNEADARRIINNFAGRAFRRPLAAGEAEPFVALATRALSEGRDFEQAVRLALKGVLCSPKFLFLSEKPGKLDDFALASRLSYFLWSSMPDSGLLKLAASGSLAQPEALRAQVARMLADPKAAAFTENFTGQWLGLRLIDFTAPDPKLYPEFDELLKVSMVREAELFFDEVLKNDLSVSNFVDSDFSMLNGRLAEHYQIPGVQGQAFRKVALPPESRRGGVMTMGAVLKITANGTNTSPVIRGAWVLNNIMGRSVPPPPAGVPAIEPDVRGSKTIRQQLDKHRDSEACNVCHVKIDPPGFALESYDVIGGFRDYYRSVGEGQFTKLKVDGRSVRYKIGPEVDASGSTPDGKSFANLADFKKILLTDRDQIARNIARKLLIYATGHGLEFADRLAVEKIVADTRKQNHGLGTILRAVVQSETFQNK